ncbi:MAG: MaoC family dehydratase [Thermomicrobia bacterium]|nr:MaoC family dehydratase [Thermomicrobia bacterium]
MTKDYDDQANIASANQPIKVGDTFAGDFTFTADDIRQMAALLGDTNPVHHTPSPPFGTVIASGAHIAGLVMAFGAAQITDRAPSLGRTWGIRFRTPIFAGETLHMVWRITAVAPHRRGTLITLAGEGTVEREGERVVAITTDGTAVLLDASAVP